MIESNISRRGFLSLGAMASLVALAGCSSSGGSQSGDGGSSSGGAVKIGVLVADTSGEEAQAFRKYYEGYIAEQYGVEMHYTEQLADAAAERSAIEEFAAQGIQAVISFSSSDRAVQIETCAKNKIYYAVASGMLDDEQFETYKSNEYFVGQVGPSMTTEYEAGQAMGKHFAGLGNTKVSIYGAFIPNPMHVYRTAGVIVGLGDTYGGASDMAGVVGQIFADQALDVTKVAGPVEVAAYFQGYGDTTTDEFNAAVQAEPEAFISVGMATTFFAQQISQAKIPFSDIDSFTETNGESMKSGSLVYLAGKLASSIGPVFAATYDAVNGNAIRDGSDAVSVSQGYIVATTSDEFEKYYTTDSGDDPIYSKSVLDEVIGADVSYEDFKAFVEKDRA